EAMRKEMDALPMRGTVVIGEGERDQAPMLYIGEKVGQGRPEDLEVDIAVDPLEGTNLCATGSPGAIAVLAASNRGGLLHAPEGVLTAAALRCLNGGMRARLVPTKPGQEERMHRMGITDVKRIYTERDLAPGPDILFVATGVTDGTLMRGVRFFGGGIRTSSVL